MIKYLLKLLTSFSIIVIFCFVAIFSIILYYNAPNSYHKEDKRFIVESGLTLREVVNKLHSEQIIKHPSAFLYLGQLIKGIDPKS